MRGQDNQGRMHQIVGKLTTSELEWLVENMVDGTERGETATRDEYVDEVLIFLRAAADGDRPENQQPPKPRKKT